jgi:deazaflavin-dependent oxidoreductase (nitroreductase family)
MTRGGSRFWDRYFQVQYRIIRWLDPLIRLVWAFVPLADTEELVVTGRRTGRRRAVLVGLMRVDGGWYVGHPNGLAAQWVNNLRAMPEAEVRLRRGATVRVVGRLLAAGEERDQAIRETWRQHPFPGNVVYWLARHHIEAVGEFFRLEPG